VVCGAGSGVERMGFLSVAPVRHAELMDDPSLGEAEHLHALRALGTINAVSRTAATVAAAAASLVPVNRAAAVEVVDVACGGGDVTLACGRRLARLRPGTPFVMQGIDMSGRALARAHAVARRAKAHRPHDTCRIAFIERDVVTDGCPPCDIAVSSLFVHHLEDATAISLLRGLAEACRLGFVISDLIRSPLGLALAVVGTNVLSRSRVARTDGPLSVRAARTPAEYRRLLEAAGLHAATLRRTWPERVLIVWRTGAPG